MEVTSLTPLLHAHVRHGGNFVGGNKELSDLVKELDQRKIAKSTGNQGIK